MRISRLHFANYVLYLAYKLVILEGWYINLYQVPLENSFALRNAPCYF